MTQVAESNATNYKIGYTASCPEGGASLALVTQATVSVDYTVELEWPDLYVEEAQEEKGEVHDEGSSEDGGAADARDGQVAS